MLSVFSAKTLVWNSEFAEMCCDNYETGKKRAHVKVLFYRMPKSSEDLRKVMDINIWEYLEAGDVKHNDMKQSISKEYLRRIRKIL